MRESHTKCVKVGRQGYGPWDWDHFDIRNRRLAIHRGKTHERVF